LLRAESYSRRNMSIVLLTRTTIATPIGDLLALASDEGLCALEFGRDGHDRLERRFARWFPPHAIADGTAPVLDRTRDWLGAYFAGVSADSGAPPLDMRGAPFELRVWQALREIPAGTTVSYGSIAARLQAPGASRAVGAANGANPISIIVPCHRVIGSSGALTGYGGGLDRKKWLLAHEARWRQTAQPGLF
jgi:methylated-DNA-[protein]-cysteine S-methyltransferase